MIIIASLATTRITLLRQSSPFLASTWPLESKDKMDFNMKEIRSFTSRTRVKTMSMFQSTSSTKYKATHLDLCRLSTRYSRTYKNSRVLIWAKRRQECHFHQQSVQVTHRNANSSTKMVAFNPTQRCRGATNRARTGQGRTVRGSQPLLDLSRAHILTEFRALVEDTTNMKARVIVTGTRCTHSQFNLQVRAMDPTLLRSLP